MQNHTENKVYAGFFVRLVAYAIDSLIAALVVAIVKSPFSIAAFSGVEFLSANFIFHYSFLDVLGYVGVAVYFILLTYYTHTTVGKKMMRLEVITESGEWTLLNVIYRETIGRFFSSLLCVGYLAVFVQEKKQGFHDMLCDTFVVYKDVIPKEKKESVEATNVITENNATAEMPNMPAEENVTIVSADATDEGNVADMSMKETNAMQPPVYHMK